MSVDSVSKWFVVQIQTGKENIAVTNLERQGFEAWCPMLLRPARSGRKTRHKLKALFPGYLFVRLDPDIHRWRSIDGTFGVIRLVRSGTRPSPLPDGLVERLAVGADESGIVSFDEALERGDRVRVLTGAFDDWIGTVVDLPAIDRVTLLLDMVGRHVPVTVPKSGVVRAA